MLELETRIVPDKSSRSPTVFRFLSDTTTPLAAFQSVSAESAVAFLFDSSDHDSRLARFSIIGTDPLSLIEIRGRSVVCLDMATGERVRFTCDNPLDSLREILQERFGALPPAPELQALPFTAGLVGCLASSAVASFEPVPLQDADPLNVPDAIFGLYDSAAVFDHLTRTVTVVSYRSESHARDLYRKLTAPGRLAPLSAPRELSLSEIFEQTRSSFTPEEFLEAVARSKDYISEGQVFQIVLAQRFSTPAPPSALEAYRMLQSLNPSPYSYILTFPEFSYLGSSPETLVYCRRSRPDGGRIVGLKALAGTRPRGTTESEDRALERELRASSKEMAEHHMLVDLGRNDIGRLSKPATVATGEIASVTRYSHVMHLSTEVTGQLKDELDAFDAVKACFPAGTVSGAPKIRALQLLSRLEPEQRGIYSGMVGYFDASGQSDGAIAIRSALIKDGIAHVSAGAGIVADSDAAAELAETRNKAAVVLKAIRLAFESRGGIGQ